MRSSEESYSCIAACGRLIQAVLSAPETKVRETRADKKSDEPCRLLDLPIEIRLMIYEQLETIHTLDKVPLLEHKASFSGFLIKTTLDGVAILATCRRLRQEAGRVLYPRLARMLHMPPTMILKAKYMIALCGVRSYFFRNVLQIIVDTLRDDMPFIHEYFRGTRSILSVRYKLRLHHEVWSDHAFKSLLKFLVRIEKRIRGAPPSITGCPPIALVISKPSSWTGYTYRVSIHPIRVLVHIIIYRQRPHRMTIHAPFSLLVEAIAYRAVNLYRSRMTPQLSITIFLDFPDVPSDLARQILAESYRLHVEAGITRRSGSTRPHNLVEYGGVWNG